MQVLNVLELVKAAKSGPERESTVRIRVLALHVSNPCLISRFYMVPQALPLSGLSTEAGVTPRHHQV